MNEEILNYEMAHAIYVLIVCGLIVASSFILLFLQFAPWKIKDRSARKNSWGIIMVFSILIGSFISVPVVMSINDIIKINVSPELFIADLNQFKGEKK